MPKKTEHSFAADDQLGIVPKLILLCYEDDVAGVIRCLSDGANIRDTTCLTNGYNEMITGVTALYVAAQRGNYSLCKVLLFCGADPRAKTHNLSTGQEFTPADVALFNMHLRTWWLIKHYLKKTRRSHNIDAWEKLLSELQMNTQLCDVDTARAWRLGQQHGPEPPASDSPSSSVGGPSISTGLSSYSFSGSGIDPDMQMMVNADLQAASQVSPCGIPCSPGNPGSAGVRASAVLHGHSYGNSDTLGSRPGTPGSPMGINILNTFASPTSPLSPASPTDPDILAGKHPALAGRSMRNTVVAVLGAPLPPMPPPPPLADVSSVPSTHSPHSSISGHSHSQSQPGQNLSRRTSRDSGGGMSASGGISGSRGRLASLCVDDVAGQ